MYKQVILVRDDLKLSKGKLISQCCHASLEAWKRSSKKIREKWEEEGGKKVVLKITNEEGLLSILEKLKEKDIPHYLVKDRGLTEIPPGTTTALGIGPVEEEKIDQITGNLKPL